MSHQRAKSSTREPKLLRFTLFWANIALIQLLLMAKSYGQVYVDGTRITVQKNVAMHVEGDFRTIKSASVNPEVRNWGTIAIKGNAQFHKDTDYKGQGNMCLLGSSQQSLTTNGIPLKKLDIQNRNNVQLGDSMNIQGELKLTSGFLLLGNHNLVIDDSVTITGGSDSSYLRINGTGKVIRKGGSGVTFPVGYNPYAPVTIDCSSCGSVDFIIGVADNVYDNPVTSFGQKTTNVVDQQWDITASSSVSNVSITLGWEQSEETTGFTRTASGIGHWESGVSTAWNAQNPTTASGSNPYSLSKTLSGMSTNTYYFGVGSNGSALPVEFTYFQAEWRDTGAKRSQSAQLTWQTAMEENNSHFEVERALGISEGSTHDLNWEQIGRVEGVGNSLSAIDYTFTDQLETQNQIAKTIYYRLKQVDNNGNFEYSEVRTLHSTQQAGNSISIYPNPASGVVYVNSNYPIEKLEVLTLQGQVILSSEKDSRMLDISSLATGVYLIRTLASGQVHQQKLRVN